jgi:hypothetical protein
MKHKLWIAPFELLGLIWICAAMSYLGVSFFNWRLWAFVAPLWTFQHFELGARLRVAMAERFTGKVVSREIGIIEAVALAKDLDRYGRQNNEADTLLIAAAINAADRAFSTNHRAPLIAAIQEFTNHVRSCAEIPLTTSVLDSNKEVIWPTELHEKP